MPIFWSQSACRSRHLPKERFSLALEHLFISSDYGPRLWLMASTCAGYDDDAQICCEHGGEGGQNVSLSMLLLQLTAVVNMKNMNGWWWWFLPLLLFLVCVCALLLSPFFISHLHWVYHWSKAAWQPDEGWRGKERAASRGL